MKTLTLLASSALLAIHSLTASADIITFDFTGRLIVADAYGNVVPNAGSTYTPIAATLTYDTVSGIGSSDLSITMNTAFLGYYATFHDISMSLNAGTTISGNILVDWNNLVDSPLHIEWDATGLLNAINLGLSSGDVLSGNRLYYDANGNETEDPGEFRSYLGSATPYSSYIEDIFYGGDGSVPYPDQGPAPLAATSGSLGLLDTTSGLAGFRGYFDIGSGNSMHVTSVTTVPVPAAVWLFGSGLLGLIGIARRKN